MKSEPATPSGQAKTSTISLFAAAAHVPVRRTARVILGILLACINTSDTSRDDYLQTRASQAHLAAQAECSVDTVQRALDELKGLGVVDVRQRGLRYTNVTTLNPERLLEVVAEARAFRRRLDAAKLPLLEADQMRFQEAAAVRHDLESPPLASPDLELSEYPSAEASFDSERFVGEGVTETYTPSTAEEPQSPEDLPDDVLHYGDLIEREAYEQIVAAHEHGEVADGPAQAALKGVQKHRYDLGRLALSLVLSTGILDAEIVSSVRQWVRKCVCVHSTTDRDHYVRILIAFLDAKAERVGKMSGRLESSGTAQT